MMIFQIVAIGIIATILTIILRQQKPEMAILVSIVAGVLIFLLLLGDISSMVNMINTMSKRVNLNSTYLSTILKVIAIAYITEFGAQICKDAGEGAIASKIELGGKIIIMVLAIPIIATLFELLLKILS